MDIASLVGLILGAVMVVFGILSSGGNIVEDFMDLPSVIITIGGSLAGTLASHKLANFIDASEVISNIINLSNISRKEGLLALEEATHDMDDEFLKKGINLVVDGTDPDLVRGILETDLINLEARHKKVIGFWEKWAELGPAWGMIGTLIGLVNMLKNLTDSSSIGPNMAVALLTTLYGPTAAKLKVNNDMEIMMREITVEGLLSIQAGENPRVIEEKLKSFLAPSDRDNAGSEDGGEA